MSIFRHRHTGMLCRQLLTSFCLTTQEPQIVYMELETGRIYNREVNLFYHSFKLHEVDPQSSIVKQVDYACDKCGQATCLPDCGEYVNLENLMT